MIIGNEQASRISILYKCLRAINLLENPKFTPKAPYISSKIYANAALQSYIGLEYFPFVGAIATSHFWKLANNQINHRKRQVKWLEMALTCDEKSEIWKSVV